MKQGWEIKKLGDICYPKKEIKRASTYCSSSDRITYIDISSIDAASNRIVAPNEMLFKDAPSRAQQMVMRHDVLVSLVRPNLKNIAMVHTAIDYLVASSGFCVLRTKENPYYIKYLVTGEKFTKYLMSRTSGANYPAVREDDIRSFQICVPPIAEQEKIVAELDCLSGIIEKKKQQLKELNNLALSIFYEMFGDPVENDKGWETSPIKDVAPQQVYKGNVPCVNGKYWLLNLDVVVSNTGEVLQKCYFELSEIGNSTITFSPENVLYSKLRPYLNKVVLPNDIGYATSELIPLCPNKDLLDRVFLAHLLRSSQFVTYISNKVAGAKMPRVSMGDFRTFPVMLPPLTLQQDFASKIESIEKQKELIAKSIKETETLFNSRMDYYFN